MHRQLSGGTENSVLVAMTVVLGMHVAIVEVVSAAVVLGRGPKTLRNECPGRLE